MVESDKPVTLVPIFSDPAYYTKALNYRRRTSNYVEAVQKWADASFCGHVVEKLVANIGDGSDDKPLYVLGVGSGRERRLGTGWLVEMPLVPTSIYEVELVFLNKLLLKFPKIHTCVVEPCVNLLTQYQHNMKEKATNLTFDWQNRTFEEFVKLQQEKSLKYHFISACHSMYYVKNLNETLQSLYDMLALGGIILITITADYAGTGKVCRILPSEDESPNTASSSPHYRDSADIHDALRQLQIPYHIDTYKCHRMITRCFDEKESEEGNLVLDFLTHTFRFRDTPKDLFQQVLACIKDCSVQRGNDWFFQSEHVCYFISKPK
ncbi:histamine N-methyltransferase-like [Amphiura filiformis]|uniref:histamine N-methyltransferase-like n=1 Tax=Amphiura filiformis TaxID=82378 RepID=UPI003B20F453